MINKMDKILAKTLSITSQEVECLVYVENLETAEKLCKKHNIKILHKFSFINAMTIITTKENLKKISKYKEINYFSAQSTVFAMMNIARQILGVDSNFKTNDTTIAYIDTGIFPHLDFTLNKNRIIKFLDLINNKNYSYDDNGHGTFVTGVGSGSGIISNGKYAGVCPDSNIVSIKALNQDGEANASKILEAMEWLYNNHKKYNIKTVCMSFGSEPLGENDPIKIGAESLWNKGITIVTAAGNSGPNYETIKSPGISEKIITVGGFDDNRINDLVYNKAFFEIANFSSRGPALNNYKPDLIAPAVDICSCGIDEPYIKLSGTSVATPMIAGLCAILSLKNPKLNPIDIKNFLLQISQPITFNKNKEGSGYPCLII